MSEVLGQVRALAAIGAVEVTQPGFRELSADDILVDDVLTGLAAAIVVEDYPDAKRGPSVLVLSVTGTIIPFIWSGAYPAAPALRPCS